ncbi:MAG: hypothetical protein JXR48_02375 [Candidatus Delongbacteria bacterium]|nr:hypothetical protein [Candidatus Delongbacteria bacterium]MBN2833793.1 hypothetical protein [Candidatus Delongbacteria bacterium]
MTKRSVNYIEKLQENVTINHLKKMQSDLLIKKHELEKIEFDLANILEFSTPLLQFLISVKKFSEKHQIRFEVCNIPFSGEDMLKLYNLEL